MRSRCELTASISIWKRVEHMLVHKHMPSTRCLFQNWNVKDTAEWLWDQAHSGWQVQCCYSPARDTQPWTRWAWKPKMPGSLVPCSAGSAHALLGCPKRNKSVWQCSHHRGDCWALCHYTGHQVHESGMWSSITRCCHCCTDCTRWECGWAPKAFWRALVPQNHLLIYTCAWKNYNIPALGLGVLKSFSMVNTKKCTHTYLHFLFQMLRFSTGFYFFFLGLFLIVYEEILNRNKFLKKTRIYTSHNSPWCCAGDTGFLSAQFRESSIY